FQLEAAIQSAHTVRRHGRSPDWAAIVVLYDGLLRLTGSPVVALNRAVALGQLRGAEAGLAALDGVDDLRLRDYQPRWAARADLLARAGRWADARAAYGRAIGLTVDPSVRRYLADRLAELDRYVR
ncbi:MAG: RNA polymerase subunit sigma-70, partial [Vulcanimicrobiaceae bacterium]